VVTSGLPIAGATGLNYNVGLRLDLGLGGAWAGLGGGALRLSKA
jgi:hypothetical protein